MSISKRYDDQQRAEFIELAQQIGIGRAIRELGYPSYPTAQAWVKAAGVVPNVDSAFQAMKDWHLFYQTEELLIIVDESINVIRGMLTTVETADDAKKLNEALQKAVNTRLLLEGKSTSITEKRELTKEDSEFEQALREFRATESPRGITADDVA